MPFELKNLPVPAPVKEPIEFTVVYGGETMKFRCIAVSLVQVLDRADFSPSLTDCVYAVTIQQSDDSTFLATRTLIPFRYITDISLSSVPPESEHATAAPDFIIKPEKPPPSNRLSRDQIHVRLNEFGLEVLKTLRGYATPRFVLERALGRPIEEVTFDPNLLGQVVVNFIKGWASANQIRFGRASPTGFDPQQSPHSFFRRNKSPEWGGTGYKPGGIFDVIFCFGGKTYFCSVFFNAADKLIQYRLVRIAEHVTAPLKEFFVTLGERSIETDQIVDEGEVPYRGEDAVEAAKPITDWLRFQVERQA